ncbi:hypothetical protein Tco_0906805 [Tanacetum coccineum]|uniref:Uncharacterized protein n=1 Tax=Tanacetum coccineum TaxID=301880 RepID=A0ABQ5CHP8_9ASTR
MKKAFQDMLHGLGEVNPTHAYYNGSCTSKDTEDPSWSTSFKTRRTQKTSSALEDFICVVFVPDRNIVTNPLRILPLMDYSLMVSFSLLSELQAEAISPLMSVLQSRVPLPE